MISVSIIMCIRIIHSYTVHCKCSHGQIIWFTVTVLSWCRCASIWAPYNFSPEVIHQRNILFTLEVAFLCMWLQEVPGTPGSRLFCDFPGDSPVTPHYSPVWDRPFQSSCALSIMPFSSLHKYHVKICFLHDNGRFRVVSKTIFGTCKCLYVYISAGAYKCQE